MTNRPFARGLVKISHVPPLHINISHNISHKTPYKLGFHIKFEEQLLGTKSVETVELIFSQQRQGRHDFTNLLMRLNCSRKILLSSAIT